MRRVSPSAASGSRVQRQCATCEDETLRRAPSGAAGVAAQGAASDGAGLDVDAAEAAARQGGSPLPDDLRAFFEPRFGQDFSAVRVHADSGAADAARAVQARAYTLGAHIVFDAGEYAPHTDGGRRLLAHELTHVVQQGGAGVGAGAAAPVTDAEVHRQPATIMRDDSCGEGDTPRSCVPFTGPPLHPDKVSETMVGRWMGKFAAVDGDPGEGCIERPYVAAAGEKVCTIGYGIQLPNCPVVSKATGGEPTKEERFPPPPKNDEEKKTWVPGVQRLRCNCPDQKPVDCKGAEAENILRSRARAGEAHVHKVVAVSLDQAQYDALVDITLHHGSMPAELLAAINAYWCSDAGWDHIRQLYLKSMINPQGSKTPSKGFIDRRRRRVWPQRCT
ncbi:hypothetical protein CDL60_19470 [Roseateles noduli]|nr:hypothetical protein CDL60_19470 [Roseateles noduli]